MKMQSTRSKLDETQAKVDNVKTILQKNVEAALEREHRVDILDTKAEELSNLAPEFAKGAQDLNRQMCKRNLKIALMIACVLVLIALLIYWQAK